MADIKYEKIVEIKDANEGSTVATTSGSVDTSAFAPVVHTHVKSDITDFSHTHIISDITDIQTTFLKVVNTQYKIINDTYSLTLFPVATGEIPTGGWAREFKFKSGESGTYYGAIGVYGTEDNVNYTYLVANGSGNTSHSSLNTLRIYPTYPAWGTNKIWHAGNDGSGSGLDADKLDGYQAYELRRRSLPIQIVYVVQKQYVQRANIDALQKDRFYLNASVTDLSLNITNFNEGDTIEIYLPDSAGARIYFSIFSEDGDQYALKTTYPTQLNQNDYLITIKAMKNTSGLVAIIDFKELFNF